jgi:hypothetical protein
MRRWIEDRLRAENLFLAALVLIATTLVLLHFLATAALDPSTAGAIAWSWGIQLGALTVFVLTCIVGFEPEITITYTGQRLEIREDEHETLIDCSEIESADRISDETYYNHFRRYARTQSFVNHLPPHVILLRTDTRPIVLGLDEDGQESLLEILCATSFDVSSTTSVTS